MAIAIRGPVFSIFNFPFSISPPLPGQKNFRNKAIPMSRQRPIFLWSAIPILTLAVAAGVLSFLPNRKPEPEPILFTVQKSDYAYHLTVEGDLASSVNTEIKCEVSSIENWRPKISEIAPDGSLVKKGEVILRIDTSKIEEKLLLQEIHLLEHLAEQREYEMKIKSLEKEREAYRSGDLEIAKMDKASAIYKARTAMKEKERILSDSLALYDQGCISDAQLTADLVALQNANNTLELEILRSDVLEQFVSQLKMLKFDTQFYTEKVRLSSNEKIIIRVQESIDKYRENIEKSVVVAPQDGMVVHVVPWNWNWENQYLKVGDELYQEQVVLKLPNPEMMEVAVQIEESDVSKVPVGTKARITFDAIKGATAFGALESIRPFADSDEWLRPGKRYSAVVSLDREQIAPFARQIRPGLTALVDFLIDERKDTLKVPSHAVVEQERAPCCLVWERGEATPKKVTVETDNGSFAVISDGLQPGDRVVCGAKAYLDR